MTFKDLLEQFSFDEVTQAFKALWQRNAPEQAAQLDMEGWRKIYHSIQEIKPVHSPYYIRLEYRWESCVPMIDMNSAVYAKEDNTLCYPLSNHSHWAESIGMEIVVAEDVKITPKELAAGLLWEITYYGGTEAMSNENQERIFNRNRIEFPSKPKYPEETKEADIISLLNIKERNCYFQLEAEAATIGKYIHSGGVFSVARKELQNKMVKPYSTDGNGKDTLIYAHTPSVNPQKVEDTFFGLQKWHRQNERELNKMKFAIKKQAEKKTLEDIQQFKQALEQEKQRHMQLFTQYKEWQLEERERISRLKIVVPEALQDTYERLNKLEE